MSSKYRNINLLRTSEYTIHTGVAFSILEDLAAMFQSYHPNLT